MLMTGTGCSLDPEEEQLNGDVLGMCWQDGLLMLAIGKDGEVELNVGTERRSLSCKGADEVAFSYDGKRIAVASGTQIHVFGTRDGALLWGEDISETAGEHGQSLLEWSRNGEHLVAAGFGGVALLDGSSGAVLKAMPAPGWFA